MISSLFAKLAALTATPTGTVVAAWLLFSIFGFFLKPRTPEQYARVASRSPVAFWSRLAAFWQLVGSLGIDPLKVALATLKIVTGHVVPPEDMKRLGDLPPAPPSNADMPLTIAIIKLDSDSDPPPPSAVERALHRISQAVVGGAVMLLLAACSGTSIQPSDVQDAKERTQWGLTTLQQVCALANALFPATTVARACGITEPYREALDRFLASSAKTSGAATEPRPYPVTCEDTDGGIVCIKPFVDTDGGR